MAYIRFVCPAWSLRDGISYGIFGPAYQAARNHALPDYYRKLIREHLNWFEDHMPVPDKLHRRHSARRRGIGICWLKPEAQGMIARMHDLAFWLTELDWPVQIIAAERPGKIIYEDHCQIVAEAFKA